MCAKRRTALSFRFQDSGFINGQAGRPGQMTTSIWERAGPRHWRVTMRAAVERERAYAENPYLRGLFGNLLLGPPDTSPMRQQEEIWRGFWGEFAKRRKAAAEMSDKLLTGPILAP